VKGYFNMGLARWGTATLLTVSATAGIVLAMKLTGVWGASGNSAEDFFWGNRESAI
jgi:hypothetical protein